MLSSYFMHFINLSLETVKTKNSNPYVIIHSYILNQLSSKLRFHRESEKGREAAISFKHSFDSGVGQIFVL